MLRRRTILLGLICGLLGLSVQACTVAMLSQYDEQIDRGATELYRRMDLHLTWLEHTTGLDAAYDTHRLFYADYAAELRTLRLRASTHPRNEPSLAQYDLMLGSLEDLRATHEEQGTVSPAYAAHVRELFAQAWLAIIRLEVAKKRERS